jgi:hypothetical protein
MRTQTKANQKRTSIADDFALKIVNILDEFAETYDRKFSSLGQRLRYLNEIEITRRNGSEWDKTAIRRVIERVERLRNETD